MRVFGIVVYHHGAALRISAKIDVYNSQAVNVIWCECDTSIRWPKSTSQYFQVSRFSSSVSVSTFMNHPHFPVFFFYKYHKLHLTVFVPLSSFWTKLSFSKKLSIVEVQGIRCAICRVPVTTYSPVSFHFGARGKGSLPFLQRAKAAHFADSSWSVVTSGSWRHLGRLV